MGILDQALKGPVKNLIKTFGISGTLYRPTDTVQASRMQSRTWAQQATAVKVVLQELAAGERIRRFGHESKARYLGLFAIGTGVLKGDGFKVDASAPHHAGRQFIVAADPNDTEGAVLMTALEEADRERFQA